jgi:hypothetical protein
MSHALIGRSRRRVALQVPSENLRSKNLWEGIDSMAALLTMPVNDQARCAAEVM